ncbi:MAG: hypothetical protein QXJ97_03250 [Desulfurococcaceae archaeon]
MKLSEFVEKYPGYKPYVELLRDFMMESPEKIDVHTFSEAIELGYTVGENVLGFAVPPDKVFFREIPPELHTFIHELIHLCRKPPIVHEEMYAYNLINLIIFCVEKRIKCKPFALFTLTVNDIERVLRKYGIQSIEEYYLLLGIIPFDYVVEFDSEGRMIGVKPSEALLRNPRSERRVVEVFVTELISGIPYYTDDSLEVRILLDLIEIAGGSR